MTKKLQIGKNKLQSPWSVGLFNLNADDEWMNYVQRKQKEFYKARKSTPGVLKIGSERQGDTIMTALNTDIPMPKAVKRGSKGG